MAKYIRHYYVDGADLVTYLTDTNTGRDGKTHPRIAGLDVKFWFHDSNGIDYCLSVVPDTTSITVANGLTELTYADWAADAQSQFEVQRAALANNADELARLNLTAEQVQAMTFDSTTVDTMLSSFDQLAPRSNML